jgi:hypothetical protein
MMVGAQPLARFYISLSLNRNVDKLENERDPLTLFAGTGSVGLNTKVQVSERPVTQQGLVGMKTGSQGDLRPSALLGVPSVAVCLASLAIVASGALLTH